MAAMIASDFKDSDGFRLQFEEACTDEEKKFYIKTFPRVDDVAKDRIHCTTCDVHVGTAPISEKIIRTHQILNVTQCNKCYAFYNSGEFGKGEDGSEYYCRWCGQGGEVFCCSTCPFVFCNKCIRDNLTQSYIREIESNDDWSCFVCNKDILKRLRAQHWALRNFMNKQLEKIQRVNINSEDELNNMLHDDSATCCPRKKRKQSLKPSPAPIKRPSMNGGSIVGQPPAKRQQIIAPTKPLKVPVNSNYHMTKPGPKPQPPGPIRRNNDEIVCTPDIMGLFKDKNKPSTSNVPPPLIMRNNQQRPVRPPPGPIPANPIFHTVNGYQIDLNQAARQEIFRLPNGKLIQVRKQTNSQQQNAQRSIPMHTSGPRTQFTIRPNQPMMQTRMIRPPGVPQLRAVRPPAPQRPAPPPASTQTSGNASTIFLQQNGSISVARAPQPDNAFGKAKTAFEDKIINGLEICQHTINKMITLTNSTSFKSSRNFSDLKELYIHLQYLFTYTSGKIKTLQDNLVTGMEELTKHDVAQKEKNEDRDELEIVEQKQEVIEVLSDDEGEETPVVAKKEPQPSTSSAAAAGAAQENEEIKEETAAKLVDTAQKSIQIIPQSEVLKQFNVDSDDKKLNIRSVVKVERLEDSKSSVVKQFMISIQQRRDRSESRESSPIDFPFMPEVVMDEGDSEAPKDSSEKEVEEEGNAEKSEENADASKDTTAANSMEVDTSNDVVEIASDDECDKSEIAETTKESDEPSTAVTEEKDEDNKNDEEEEESEPKIREEKDDDVSTVIAVSSQDSVIAISSQDSATTEDATESATNDNDKSTEVKSDASTEENGKANDGEEQSNVKEDVSMLSTDDISKITSNDISKIATNGIDDEKDLLDNLINSLDETEPLASIELENFP